jgi:hypothetical protein
MQIPGADRAVVKPEKIRDYLLDQTHPVGRSKAQFFATLGYSKWHWPELAQTFKELALEDAALGQTSPHGQKYEIHATLSGPSHRFAEVVVVWIVLHEEDFPRFVTAYPGVRR